MARPEVNAHMRIGLILAAIAFATGIAAAMLSEAMLTPSPGPLPPLPTAPVAPPGRQLVPAPIDMLDIKTLESAPPRYVANVLAGLPSGCAQQDGHDVARSGDVITITVLNSMPTGNPVCTMIYGNYELNVDLGSDFKPGVAYTVVANDKKTSFTAR